MTKQIIETFPQTIEFDTTFLSCIEDILPTLSIRIKVNNKPIEYRFYRILEYNQAFLDTKKPSQLYFHSEGEALTKLLNRAPEVISSDVDLSEYKHYVWQVNKVVLNIFAAGYVTEDCFTEIYREQEKVKQIIV